jgi:hypothetical protein
MSFTYTTRPGKNNIDTIRFHIQDTVDAGHILEDEEIQYLIDQYEIINVNAICSECCERMASRWARKQEFAVSNYNCNADSVYRKLMDLANDFRTNSVTSDSFRAPAISKTSKDTQNTDSDRVMPSFARGILDNPEATTSPFRKVDNAVLEDV